MAMYPDLLRRRKTSLCNGGPEQTKHLPIDGKGGRARHFCQSSHVQSEDTLNQPLLRTSASSYQEILFKTIAPPGEQTLLRSSITREEGIDSLTPTEGQRHLQRRKYPGKPSPRALCLHTTGTPHSHWTSFYGRGEKSNAKSY